jgi:hypothetical protein
MMKSEMKMHDRQKEKQRELKESEVKERERREKSIYSYIADIL